MSVNELFSSELKVVNIGLESFETALARSGVKVAGVNWRPPLAADFAAISKLRSRRADIDKANAAVLEKILHGKARLCGMGLAGETIPGMKKNLILHAGPPITWERMCGPMRGAIIGALIYEGLAANPEEAKALAASGKIEFSPCHEHNAVGPMAGIVSYSMPVFIVENSEFGNRSYSTQNEGLGKVLRYGAYSPEVITRLHWMQKTLYPALKAALAYTGPIDLKAIIAQALHMGDEVHNRNRAASSLLYRALAPAVVRTSKTDTAAQVLEFINGNDHFFLNLSMATAKALLDAARNVPNSSVAVVMARNGTDFGVQLAGTGGKWFTGPAPVPDALFFAGFTKADANPDIGDSAITETCGLGGFAIAAAPAIVQFVGGKAADAAGYTLAMYEITAGENNAWQIPAMDFRGVPLGIDVLKVVESGILPFIDTGVAHKEPGVGHVGAGVVSAPAEPFIKAAQALAEELK